MLGVGVLLLGTVSLFLSGCSPMEDLEIRAIRGLTLDDANAGQGEIQVALYNPNPYDIKVNAVDLRVDLEGQPVGRVELSAPAKLPSGETTYVGFAVVWDGPAFTRVSTKHALIWLVAGAQVSVSGTVHGRAYLISRTVQVHHQQLVRLSDLRGR
jgi:hypothetical protein